MSNLKDKYDWDLEQLLQNSTIDKLFEKWLEYKNEILDLYPSFCETEENFIKWKEKNLEFEKISNRLSNYISNNLNEDVINPIWNGWSQKLSNEANELSIKMSDSVNIVLKNKAKILKYLENPILKDYVRDYKILFEKQKHVLGLKEEKLLSELSIIDDGFEEIFSTLVDGTIKFDDVKNKNGKTIKLKSVSDVFLNLKSNDRVLRKNTWYSFNDAYYKHRNVLTSLLYYNYLMLNTNAKIRKYEDYIDATCVSDEIDKSLIFSIYKNVEEFQPLYKKFYNLRDKITKKIFNLDSIEPWDRSLDLMNTQIKYSIEESKEIALNALSVYGEEYVDVVKKAFDNKWISWLSKPNKHSGAYSIGGTLGLDTYYISMNFDKTLSSIYTLVHELGHSIHSYYFGKTQEVNCSCEIFYAEIASITNEVILSLYLLENSNNDKTKIKILDELITGFFGTTTRQIIFSEFEYQILEKIKNKEPITYDVVKEVYANLNEKYSGSNKKRMLSKKYEKGLSTILRVSHFYVGNFYVYKYAVGQIPAMISGYKIFNKDEEFKNKYFKFLESGSSISPLETINLLDINLKEDKPFKECFEILKKLINEFELLAKKVYKI